MSSSKSCSSLFHSDSVTVSDLRYPKLWVRLKCARAPRRCVFGRCRHACGNWYRFRSDLVARRAWNLSLRTETVTKDRPRCDRSHVRSCDQSWCPNPPCDQTLSAQVDSTPVTIFGHCSGPHSGRRSGHAGELRHLRLSGSPQTAATSTTSALSESRSLRTCRWASNA